MNIKWILNKYLPNPRYEYASNVVLEHEGYFSNDKKDPGGATQWGISLRFLQRAGIDVIEDNVIDLEDVKAITKEDAKAIYYTYFWKKYQIDKIESLILATKLLDMSVNMGNFEATKLLQKSINEVKAKSIIVDGIMGKQTIAATNQCDFKILHNQLIAEQKLFYLNLIEKKPTLVAFKEGWLNRASW